MRLALERLRAGEKPVVAGPTSSERMSTPATANDAASAAMSAAGCTHDRSNAPSAGETSTLDSKRPL